MSGGVIPSKAFNEQLKRTVRETMRREHSTQRPRGRWHKKGGGGGGGGASTGCQCACAVVNPNLIHWGNFPTVFEWLIEIPNNTPLEPTSDGKGWVQFVAGTYPVMWDEEEGKWISDDLSAHLLFVDLNLDAVTPDSATATITAAWESATDDYIVNLVFDGELPDP